MRAPKWNEIEIGGAITKPGNSAEVITGLWRSLRPVIDLKKCIKCAICWMYCPDAAIIERSVEVNGKIERIYEIDYDHCKGCGICASECPVKAVELVMER